MNGENPLPDPREKEIFCGALEIKDPQKRAEYLDAACGNNKPLRDSVEKLLSAADHGGTLGSLFSKITSEKIQEIEEGTQTGKYSILNRVGGGGWGEVFRAKQKKILNRFVAIKFLNQGLDAESVLERFKREHEILADLNNPHIVTIFDQGVTSSKYGRRPYFVMEFVDGERITDYADNHRLNVNERLELFLQVCDAIQTAHTKKIIHRDIKPDNLLVTEINRRPFLKVIDFGIAKVVNNGLPLVNATQTGQRIGTPAYMSPEQTGEAAGEVSESTDIYSLGVLLYELLVGILPLEIKGFDKEQICIIREQTPLPPSKRINEKGKGSYFQVAQKRGSDPAQLEKNLSGELDRIVMKCLEKDRRKRFISVGELIIALQNFLVPRNGGPPSNSNTKPILSVLAICVAVVVLVGFYIKIRPNFSTPEGFVKIMCNPKARAKYNREIINRSTTTGCEVWEYLKTNSFYLEKGTGNIEEHPENGRRRELKMKYTSSEGADEISVVFFVETNILKFHDVYIYSWEGCLYSNYLSAKINDPVGFEEKTRRLNLENGTVLRSDISTNSSMTPKATTP